MVVGRQGRSEAQEEELPSKQRGLQGTHGHGLPVTVDPSRLLPQRNPPPNPRLLWHLSGPAPCAPSARSREAAHVFPVTFSTPTPKLLGEPEEAEMQGSPSRERPFSSRSPVFLQTPGLASPA